MESRSVWKQFYRNINYCLWKFIPDFRGFCCATSPYAADNCDEFKVYTNVDDSKHHGVVWCDTDDDDVTRKTSQSFPRLDTSSCDDNNTLLRRQ